ncbi:MAG: thioesterase domain-containing protein, partial [Cyanobium sp.]
EDPQARLYKTGDLGRWLPTGEIEYLGRNDFQVKIRGFRIELGEIESQLSTHDQVGEVAVIAREDVPGDKRLVAYVVARGEVSPEELKAHLQSRLPDYMLPAAFVVLERFPLTPNGKLDRKALPAPEADAYASRAYAPPEGPVEEALAAIWSELLGIERIGRHDDFFSLGGHSLLVLRLVSELDQRFGVRLPVGTVFLRPSLTALAEAIGDGRLAREGAAVVPLQPKGQDPPLFLLPGAIGSVLYLQPLAWALGHGLGNTRPVLALPSPGLDGQPPLDSVAELAAHHLRALRQHQPRGPYHLAGHSSGGRVAFELARQLELEGETVASVVILDTTAPDPTQVRPERTERQLLADLVAVFEELSGQAFGLSREAIQAEPDTATAHALVMAAFQRSGVLFSQGAPVAELQALLAVYRAALQAHEGHVVDAPLRAPIHLLRASDRGGAEAFEDQRPAWGWEACTRAAVVVHDVPGTHITMMAPPQVAVLAQRLAAILAAGAGAGVGAASIKAEGKAREGVTPERR